MNASGAGPQTTEARKPDGPRPAAARVGGCRGEDAGDPGCDTLGGRRRGAGRGRRAGNVSGTAAGGGAAVRAVIRVKDGEAHDRVTGPVPDPIPLLRARAVVGPTEIDVRRASLRLLPAFVGPGDRRPSCYRVSYSCLCACLLQCLVRVYACVHAYC